MLRIINGTKYTLNGRIYFHATPKISRAITYDHTPTAHEKIHRPHRILERPEDMIKVELSPLSKVGLNVFKGIFALSDVITYLPNKFLHRGQDILRKSREKKGVLLKETNDYLIYTNPSITALKDSDVEVTPIKNITTLDKYIDYIFNRYSNQPIVGERKIEKIFEYKDNYGTKTKLLQQSDYKWETYKEIEDKINNIRRGYKKLGLKKGDKVLFYSDTRKEYLIHMLACFKEGLIVATYSPSLSIKELVNVIKDIGTNTIITEEGQFEKLNKIFTDTHNIDNIIYFKDRQRISKLGSNNPASTSERKLIPHNIQKNVNTVIPYDKFLNYSINKPIEDINIESTDVALLCYTSGTTSKPKGCILTHEKLLANIDSLKNQVDTKCNDPIYAAYLPLSYIFEICGELYCLSKGVKIGYGSTLTLTKKSMKVVPGSGGDLDALKPTHIPVVPTMLYRLKRVVSDELMNKSEFERKLFTLCYDRKLERKINGLPTPILDKIVFKPIVDLLGGRVNTIVCGGATLDQDLQRFVQIATNVNFIHGYGATEGCAVSLSSPYDITTGNVGGPLKSTNVMITNWEEGGYSIKNKTGELCISGPGVIDAYYKNYDKDSFTVIDGVKWFKTGDIVKVRDDGAIKIIGRKKDFVKTANGEFVSLNKVEETLMNSDYVDQVCVIVKPELDYTEAIVVVNQKAVKAFADKLGIQGCITELCKNKLIRNMIVYTFEEEYKEVLAKHEIPRKVILVTEPFTSKNGMLTASGKLRRNVVKECYKDIIDMTYKPYLDFVMEPEHLNEHLVEQKRRVGQM
uniref:long-chain-fatty-acid--CoA ligase n=1 Tax=Parastrongyloides trichosuri TaxID=131310 RepID=A0A0N4ZWQ2_PARTI